jgi:hypothetical protein
MEIVDVELVVVKKTHKKPTLMSPSLEFSPPPLSANTARLSFFSVWKVRDLPMLADGRAGGWRLNQNLPRDMSVAFFL